MPKPVRAEAYPKVISYDGDIRVSCWIPQSAENRAVVVGVYDFRQSFIQLEGEAAPLRTEVWYRKPPCGELVAFCELVRVRENKVQHIVDRTDAIKQCIG